MTDSVDDFLMHHGVKGMRWGVHKKNDASTTSSSTESVNQNRRSLTDKQKKILIGAAFVVGAVGLGIAAHKIGASRAFMSQNPFMLSDPRAQLGLTFQKGHEFVRQSKSIEDSVRSRAYVFSDKKDTGSFRGRHDVTLKAKQNINMATAQQVRDTLSTVVDKRDFVKNRKTIIGKAAAATMSRQGIANAKLSTLNANWWRGPEAEKVLKRLRAQGYGAMVDPIMGGSAKIVFGNDLFDVTTKS
jgi:hypothetical protein